MNDHVTSMEKPETTTFAESLKIRDETFVELYAPSASLQMTLSWVGVLVSLMIPL